MPTPVPGFQVTTPYGKKPKDRTYWQARGFHTGDDYATRRTHAPVVATRDGVVVGAGFGIGGKALGNVVVVKTGNVFHNYCHLHTITVRRGQSVRAGTGSARSARRAAGLAASTCTTRSASASTTSATAVRRSSTVGPRRLSSLPGPHPPQPRP